MVIFMAMVSSRLSCRATRGESFQRVECLVQGENACRDEVRRARVGVADPAVRASDPDAETVRILRHPDVEIAIRVERAIHAAIEQGTGEGLAHERRELRIGNRDRIHLPFLPRSSPDRFCSMLRAPSTYPSGLAPSVTWTRRGSPRVSVLRPRDAIEVRAEKAPE